MYNYLPCMCQQVYRIPRTTSGIHPSLEGYKKLISEVRTKQWAWSWSMMNLVRWRSTNV